jgi:hypothetical protein
MDEYSDATGKRVDAFDQCALHNVIVGVVCTVAQTVTQKKSTHTDTQTYAQTYTNKLDL